MLWINIRFQTSWVHIDKDLFHTLASYFPIPNINHFNKNFRENLNAKRIISKSCFLAKLQSIVQV